MLSLVFVSVCEFRPILWARASCSAAAPALLVAYGAARSVGSVATADKTLPLRPKLGRLLILCPLTWRALGEPPPGGPPRTAHRALASALRPAIPLFRATNTPTPAAEIAATATPAVAPGPRADAPTPDASGLPPDPADGETEGVDDGEEVVLALGVAVSVAVVEMVAVGLVVGDWLEPGEGVTEIVGVTLAVVVALALEVLLGVAVMLAVAVEVALALAVALAEAVLLIVGEDEGVGDEEGVGTGRSYK